MNLKPEYECTLKVFPPKTLEDLMELAADYCTYCMHNGGAFSPLYFFTTDQKYPAMHIFSDKDTKATFKWQARMIAASLHSESAVFCALAQILVVPKAPGEPPPDILPIPSETPGSIECVIMCGQTRTPQGSYMIQRTLKIIRDGNGNFFNLVANGDVPDADTRAGHKLEMDVADVIAPTPPPADLVQACTKGLTLMGITVKELTGTK